MFFAGQGWHRGAEVPFNNHFACGWLLNVPASYKIKLIAEFAAKENLKSSFPLRFKARQAEGGCGYSCRRQEKSLVSWYFSFDWHSWGESVCEYIAKGRKSPTQRAVDRWVCAARPTGSQAFFSALGFFRFDSESQPAHLLLTLTVGRLLGYSRGLLKKFELQV